MKLTKKILVSIVTASLVAGCLTACGTRKKSAGSGVSATDIEISTANQGLGTEWLDRMIEAFKEEHPEYNVYYNASPDTSAVVANFGKEDIDTVDIYMATKSYDTQFLEPLDDVLNATAAGDSKKLIDKFEDYYLDLEVAEDGKYYNLTNGSGIVGLVYNQKLYDEAGIRQTPRTTDELAVVANTLYKKGITPFCHYKSTGYWNSMEETWYGQYEGADYYFDTFYGAPTKETLLKKDGRYEVIKAFETFITPDYVLSGSNSSDHVTMQTKFLNEEAAMMVNGSWLVNEMQSSNKNMDNFVMMKTPVLSAVVDKLTTVKSEPELRKLIDAVDAVAEDESKLAEYRNGDNYLVGGKEVSAADWDYVYKARNTITPSYSSSSVFIPSYSNAKEGAKEFLKFMYSDAGYKIYTDTLHIVLPITLSDGELNMDDWNTWEKTQYELLQEGEQFFSKTHMSKHKLFVDGGASLLADVSYINRFCSRNADDRVTTDEVWKEITAKIEDNYENNWLKNIQ